MNNAPMTTTDLHIVADENMPLVNELFAPLGRVTRLPGRDLAPQACADADVLLVRSVTRIDAQWLQGLPRGHRLQLIASATAGTDHVDCAAVAAAGIRFAHAPGCNADSVAEYVCTVLLSALENGEIDAATLRVGIVGAGAVGSQLARRLSALGVDHVLHDPPRQRANDARPLVDRESILACPVITLHVPLARSGDDATWHWLDEVALARSKARLIINAARGPVLDNHAAAAWRRADPARRLILDVWEDEPDVKPAMIDICDLATPHIAGYSLEGKLNGSFMLLEEVCRQFGRDAAHARQFRLPVQDVMLTGEGDARSRLLHLLLRAYDPRQDDARMRAAMAAAGDSATRIRSFDALRKNYPPRRELSQFRISGFRDAQEAALFAAFTAR